MGKEYYFFRFFLCYNLFIVVRKDFYAGYFENLMKR